MIWFDGIWRHGSSTRIPPPWNLMPSRRFSNHSAAFKKQLGCHKTMVIKPTKNSFISLAQLPGGELAGETSPMGLGLGAALTVVRSTSKVPKHVWRNMLDEFLRKIKIKIIINVFIIFHNNCQILTVLVG